ncbi:MAG TPA: response regulator [Candidatus Krumholzibacteria bacterium]|nr:response regulator [Candidatus Krumholzibacteria bacterium]
MGLKVLIVDDSVAMRRMLVRALKMTELDIDEVMQAANGQEGLDVILSKPVDLALVDIHMPVMRGPDMIRQVRATASVADLPCIVVSSESSDSRIQEMADLGVSFVSKPFTPEDISAVVGEVLSGARPQAAEAEVQLPADADEAIDRLGRQVLETMAFAFITDAEDSPPVGPGLWIRSRMPFTGPFHGEITMEMPIEALSEIADNMLGVDGEPVAKQQMLDALGELTNVFGGNLLAEFAHGEGKFELQHPEVDEYRGDPATAAAETHSTRIFFGDGWVRIGLHLGGPVPTEMAGGGGR